MICPCCKIEFKRFAKVLFSTGNFKCKKCTNSKIKELLKENQKIGKLTFKKRTEKEKGIFECECGRRKEINIFQVKNKSIKSCGCLRIENMRKVSHNKSGAESSNWKGGLTNKVRSFRTSKEYSQWRKKVFERDKYTCKKCKKEGGVLSAHHIEELSNNIDKALDINNGITFCIKCHNLFHRKYGRKNLNKKMIYSFIENETLN